MLKHRYFTLLDVLRFYLIPCVLLLHFACMFQAGFALVFPKFSHFFNFLIFILFSGFTGFSLVFPLIGLVQAILNQLNLLFRATSFFSIVVIFIINFNKMLNFKHNTIQYNAIRYIKIIHSTILIINQRIFTSISKILSLNRCSVHL